jgi:phenylpyruvate tautomerase PptA (4-oxalocrotonate tautomerase family)
MPDSQKEEIAQTLTATTVMHLQQNNESGQDVPAS